MKITRRDAIKKTSKNLGLTFIPSYLATGARAEGDPQPPSKRINLGCVGVGEPRTNGSESLEGQDPVGAGHVRTWQSLIA